VLCKKNILNINSLKVSESLSKFVKDELLKTQIFHLKIFGLVLKKLVDELAPKNKRIN
jgi:malate synthase